MGRSARLNSLSRTHGPAEIGAVAEIEILVGRAKPSLVEAPIDR
jgi:hypothetical protein